MQTEVWLDRPEPSRIDYGVPRSRAICAWALRTNKLRVDAVAPVAACYWV